MSQQIAPNSLVRIFRYITTMDAATNGIPPANRPFSEASWTSYQANRTIFLAEYAEHLAADSAQQNATNLLNTVKAEAKLYVSHYYQVINFAILRGEMPTSVRALYGLSVSSENVPKLTTEAEILMESTNIINGEAARVAAGGASMSNPTAAQVATKRVAFATANQTQGLAKTAAGKELRDVQNIFDAMAEAYMDLIDELKFANRKLSFAAIRSILREYGMEFRNDTGESTQLEIDLEAGAAVAVTEAPVTDLSQIFLTLMQGSDGTVSAKMEGSSVAGIVLSETGVEIATNRASLGDLNSTDIIKLANNGTTQAKVRVRVVG